METIIINTKDKSTAKLIVELVKKLGEKSKVLTDEQQEDFLFGQLMKSEKTGTKVTRNTIFKKLRK